MAYSGGVARIISDMPAAGTEQHVRELTVRGFILGAILALVLGAANAYLGLYAGMTVSASIPAAFIHWSDSLLLSISAIVPCIAHVIAGVGGV